MALAMIYPEAEKGGRGKHSQISESLSDNKGKHGSCGDWGPDDLAPAGCLGIIERRTVAIPSTEKSGKGEVLRHYLAGHSFYSILSPILAAANPVTQ
jgi:hypothetical protein